MHFNLNSKTYGAIRFKPVFPASLVKWEMPGSQPLSAEGPFGNILLQQVAAGSSTLIYSICSIKEDLALDFDLCEQYWLIHIALRNESRFDIDSETFCLKQGQFNMVHAAKPGTLYMERGNEYQAISISCDKTQLEDIRVFFPHLNSFIRNKKNADRPTPLFRHHHWIDSQLMSVINYLLHCTYRGNLRQLYFDYKMKELLLLLLSRQNTRNQIPKGLNDRTVELINEAKYLIESGFGQPITLHKIARQLGISEVKLQIGFRQLFGTGMADYL